MVRINSATIIETIVALIIIVLVLGLSLSFLSQIKHTESSLQEIQAKTIISRHVNKLQNKELAIAGEYTYQNFTVESNFITKHNSYAYEVYVKVFNESGKRIMHQNYIILVSNKK